MITKFLLMSKLQKPNGKAKFRKFFTYMDIEVKGEEEKGTQLKSLTVKFDDSIDTKNFVRGIITAEESDVDLPYKYEIKEVEKDGEIKKKYPHIFVKKIISYEPRSPKSTGTFNLMDEADEVEETEIDTEE